MQLCKLRGATVPLVNSDCLRRVRQISRSLCNLDLIGDVIDHIGGDHFWVAIARWVEDALRAGPPIIYVFNGKRTPEIMYQPFAGGRDAEVQVYRYLAGPYLLDPFHNASLERIPSGVYSLKDVAPDKFQQTQYFREFYRYANLVDEICFMSQVAGSDSYIVISVVRSKGQRAFTTDDLHAARRADRFIQAALRRHGTQAAGSRVGQQSVAYRAMEDFGYPVLTHREREIAGLILRGHSSKSAGALLHISAETVRNHRKRLYSKLGVASQSELFLKFITQVIGSPVTQRAPTAPSALEGSEAEVMAASAANP